MLFQNIMRAVVIAGTVAFAFSTWWHQDYRQKYQTKYYPDMTAQTEVVLHVGQIDYCGEVDIQWGAISKSGKVLKHWGTTYGPCYLLDRFEDV